MEILLETDKIRKFFPVNTGVFVSRLAGYIKAVDEVSFQIRPGETFGLVGESGCGKSTIAKLILMIEGLTGGEIRFRGRSISGLGRRDLFRYRSATQAVFQDPASSLNPRMRVGDIVSEPLVVTQSSSRREVKERLNEVFLQVGLDPQAAGRYPHEFSGGQRQRISLARALIVRPSLIVLDEPVSALDVSIRAQIMNLLREIQLDTGVAYLFIAHDLGTVRYMSDQIGVMYLGRMVEKGPAEAVFNNRIHPYTQALFSAALPTHPDQPWKAVQLTGEIPTAFNPPAGCRFAGRCPYRKSDCCNREPTLQESAPGHFAACHGY